ncbi:hydrogenase maturation protease [Gemmatimonas aurantiaca]|uniref:hydrogenase maturation protease n=1 Tax=Gemmatimonas aurantiaca TaxID=173480 RepID=UPI00301C81A2
MNDPTRVLIVGCGNLLRGDDAVGPVLVRHLWDRGVPHAVRCADGGTGGMDVGFQMRGVPHVIIVDACRSGSEPGAIFRLDGRDAETPPLAGVNLHAFRWDHALAFARWALKDEYPPRIDVWLIEAEQFEPGAPLSPSVEAAMFKVADLLMKEVEAELNRVTVQLNDGGYLVLSAQTAQRYFPGDTLLAMPQGAELWLLPTRGPGGGGLLLKQRNPAGDRSVLVREVLHDQWPCGELPAFWDADRGALRVALRAAPQTAPASGTPTPGTAAPRAAAS